MSEFTDTMKTKFSTLWYWLKDNFIDDWKENLLWFVFGFLLSYIIF